MKEKKSLGKADKVLLTLGIIGAVVLLLPVLALVFAWGSIGLGVLFSPSPAEPATTYAEFPFELVYEIDGEIHTVNDAYVCEYDGIGMNEGMGKYWKWKGHIKGTGKAGVYLTEDEDKIIYCNVGNPQYYMNDKHYPTAEPIIPRLYDVSKHSLDSSDLTQLEITKRYNIQIISWEFAEPIE